ncbi:hypothetical protein EDC01DRAFT_632562 [Geopyxis carbonaria]|nr:hypothetical protein EDC01DRAFT_632562 [Geopyxis carbonaria]
MHISTTKYYVPPSWTPPTTSPIPPPPPRQQSGQSTAAGTRWQTLPRALRPPPSLPGCGSIYDDVNFICGACGTVPHILVNSLLNPEPNSADDLLKQYQSADIPFVRGEDSAWQALPQRCIPWSWKIRRAPHSASKPTRRCRRLGGRERTEADARTKPTPIGAQGRRGGDNKDLQMGFSDWIVGRQRGMRLRSRSSPCGRRSCKTGLQRENGRSLTRQPVGGSGRNTPALGVDERQVRVSLELIPVVHQHSEEPKYSSCCEGVLFGEDFLTSRNGVLASYSALSVDERQSPGAPHACSGDAIAQHGFAAGAGKVIAAGWERLKIFDRMGLSD